MGYTQYDVLLQTYGALSLREDVPNNNKENDGFPTPWNIHEIWLY